MSMVINYNMMAHNTQRLLNNHYKSLDGTVEKLSSGLRINSAADDAAGLAISELMRSDIQAYKQGARNANDAVSLIQTADGALQSMNDLLLRMKELSEQAATGTYDAIQRDIMNKEFQDMAKEINRISSSTQFNNKSLLDGSLEGDYYGNDIESTGKLKVHFGTTNESAEDYFYIEIPSTDTAGLDLNIKAPDGSVPKDAFNNSDEYFIEEGVPTAEKTKIGNKDYDISELKPVIIPAGSTNVKIYSNGGRLQIFDRDGNHIAGKGIKSTPTNPWGQAGTAGQSFDPPTHVTTDNVDKILTEESGFSLGATYSDQIATGGNGTIQSGIGTLGNPYVLESPTTTDIIIYVVAPSVPDVPNDIYVEADTDSPFFADEIVFDEVIHIATQESAGSSLERVDEAIEIVTNVRAHLGSLENRLSGTISNLEIQAENMQVSESRIRDIDVAKEMTTFTKQQILVNSASSMLSQGHGLSRIATKLLQ